MITRIFRVRVDPAKRDEFEFKFPTVSVAAVRSQKGFESVRIGKPTKWTPNEYVMVSEWKDEEALRDFVGEDWDRAHIPKGMDQYVEECWVHHYDEYGE